MRRDRANRPSTAERHAWLDLLTTTGPFLNLPVVARVFPDGLPAVPVEQRAPLRTLIADMQGDGGASRHRVIDMVLRDVLGWRDALQLDHEVPAALAEPVAEHSGALIRPDIAFYAPSEDVEVGESGLAPDDETPDVAAAGEVGGYRLLGSVTAWGGHPLTRTAEAGWLASPVERLALLLRARGIPIGLVTDGRWWALVWAPIGGTTGVAVWDAGLFSEEPDSLRAFVALLRRSRFLGVAAKDTLAAMLTESLGAQEEVTVTLGRQVRDAVELLVRTIDQLDADSGGDLLDGVDDDELYAGVVTVLMRIVFLLFAEDRRLLPSDDDLFLSAYSIGHLVDELEREAQLAGEQALEHRTGGWHRILATTRALHGGVAHEDLRLPAYGGGLFDPAAYPWLERADRIDDRTVLRVLRAVQFVQLDQERRRLSFRTLDVEQIGYVYEGLLETEVRTAATVTVGLARSTKKGQAWPRPKKPAEVALSTLDAWHTRGELRAELADRTGRVESAVERALARVLAEHQRQALRRAAGAAHADLLDGVGPLVHWHDEGTPAVVPPGRRYLAASTRRATTGAHYTPRALAEEVVLGALEPLVKRPGPLETADRSRWALRPSTAITELRVADIAMGSGAFLVAACRYLADRLVEAWAAEGRHDAVRFAVRTAERPVTSSDVEVDEVLLAARRVIAERCLYGVDINPLAVEMAKLSLWLITMDATRPFGFLDDRLVSGDSLLGVSSVEQLELLHLDPVAGRRLQGETRHGGGYAQIELHLVGDWLDDLRRAADLRRQITAAPATTARDIEHKLRLLLQATEQTADVSAGADRLTGLGLQVAGSNAKSIDLAFTRLQIEIGLDGDHGAKREVAGRQIQSGQPAGKAPRHPLHWPVAFPEVFVDPADKGFDAIVGNPPFLGGKKISGPLGGDYLAWLQHWDGHRMKGNTDLAARFVLRANQLLNNRGQLGFITTNTLVQGDTLQVGLGQATTRGLTVRSGRTSHPWPSASASLEIVNVWASRAGLSSASQRLLDGEDVPSIGPDLEPIGRVAGRPLRLRENEDLAFQGHNVLGLGFTMSPEQAHELIDRDLRNVEALQPYVIGQDLNQRPDHSASRWIINFREWSLERAATYPDLLDILRREVLPERSRKDAVRYPRMVHEWWKFWQYRHGLERAVEGLGHLLALSRVSNVVLPVRVPTGPVFSEATVVFAMDGFGDLAVLSSSAHSAWTIRYTSTLETRIRYAPSDVFDTFPRPVLTSRLAELGERLDVTRRELMLSRAWGLTTTYNAVHNPAVSDPAIVELREIHEAIDHAVLDAYGWGDLDPQIGHHPTKIGTRWTVSREARFELLDRLLEENHRRHAAETR